MGSGGGEENGSLIGTVGLSVVGGFAVGSAAGFTAGFAAGFAFAAAVKVACVSSELSLIFFSFHGWVGCCLDPYASFLAASCQSDELCTDPPVFLCGKVVSNGGKWVSLED